MRVMKFGGSSLGTAANLRAVLDQIERTVGQERAVVVVSAIGASTDLLVRDDLDTESLAEALLDEHAHALALLESSTRARVRGHLEAVRERREGAPIAAIHAFGEEVASELVTELLVARGVKAVDLGLEPVVVVPGAEPTIDEPRTLALLRAAGLDNDALDVLVVGGFAGRDLDGRLHLLGRGGSDLSATAIGAAIGASVVELWKDVAGIHPHDPRTHPGSLPLSHLSFEEARAFASRGTQVLHPRSIEPAARQGIPVHVRPTGAPHAAGTWIHDRFAPEIREAPNEHREERVA